MEHLHEYELTFFAQLVKAREDEISGLTDDELRALAKARREEYEDDALTTIVLTGEYTQETLIEAFRREIWRQLPAIKKGKLAVGARDTLIWLDAKKIVRDGGEVTILSSDQLAFGSDAELHHELSQELTEDEVLRLSYFNDLGTYLPTLDFVEMRKVDIETVDQVSQLGLHQMINSSGTFVTLASMTNRESGVGFLRSEGPAEIERSNVLDSPYRFRLGSDEFLGMKLDFRAKKKFKFLRYAAGATIAESWTFEVDGTLTLLAKLSAMPTEHEIEVLRFNISERESGVIDAAGTRMNFIEARARVLDASTEL
jgi:hypothetical protein